MIEINQKYEENKDLSKMAKVETNRRFAGFENKLLADHKKTAGYKRFNESLHTLTDTAYIEMTVLKCYWTGIVKGNKQKYGKSIIRYNGVDRLDSSKPYTPINSVPCEGKTNRMKNNLTRAEYLLRCGLTAREHQTEVDALVRDYDKNKKGGN